MTQTDQEIKAAEARGFAVTLDTCASVFLNEPTSQLIDNLRTVAQAVDNTDFDDIVVTPELVQRYADRIFVSSSPVHVPLLESCIAGSTVDKDGVTRYGSSQSNRGDHVFRCYKTLGFDPAQLAGDPVAVKSLHADSLAAELAFLAFMKAGEAQSWDAGDDAAAHRWHDLAQRFAKEHANAWLPRAADYLRIRADDLYARTCALAADAVATIAEDPEE